MGRVTAGLDEHFRTAAASLSPSGATGGDPAELARLFEAQALSRHLDLEARRLSAAGVGYYTIGSAGH
jgi:2-oxoisovalerate dehydrogenase E1 component